MPPRWGLLILYLKLRVHYSTQNTKTHVEPNAFLRSPNPRKYRTFSEKRQEKSYRLPVSLIFLDWISKNFAYSKGGNSADWDLHIDLKECHSYTEARL